MSTPVTKIVERTITITRTQVVDVFRRWRESSEAQWAEHRAYWQTQPRQTWDEATADSFLALLGSPPASGK